MERCVCAYLHIKPESWNMIISGLEKHVGMCCNVCCELTYLWSFHPGNMAALNVLFYLLIACYFKLLMWPASMFHISLNHGLHPLRPLASCNYNMLNFTSVVKCLETWLQLPVDLCQSTKTDKKKFRPMLTQKIIILNWGMKLVKLRHFTSKG